MANITRKYVIPGDLVAEGDYRAGINVIRQGNKYFSTRIGMAEIARDMLRVIPISGPYIPIPDDLVIGKIVDYSAFAWEVDINSCFFAFLPAASVFGKEYSPSRDSLTQKFDVGDIIAAKILAADRTRDPILTINGPRLGRIPKGEIVKIDPAKVPRLIGRKGSMIRALESMTGCRLLIGQNGVMLIDGPPEGVLKCIGAVRLIEEGAHTADLNERIQTYLSPS